MRGDIAATVIERLGHRGDGVAKLGGREVFAPYTLPGERVEIEDKGGDRAHALAILAPHPDRVSPICAHFTSCGGCSLQHLDLPALLAWKRSLVVDALAQRGIDAPVDACIDAHGGGRRRVTLHVRPGAHGVEAGFMAARSHDLIAIEACPVLAPALTNAAQVARAIGDALSAARKALDIQITETLHGLDVDVRGLGKIDDATRLVLSKLGEALRLARLSVHGDIIAAWRAPQLRMGRALIVPPAGGFLQATSLGEETLATLALQAIGAAKHVADLFAGCGPFALRIAERARVHAVDSERRSIDALSRAARGTSGLKPITMETRDLFRRPLLAHELDAYDAVVMDPPRAGAEAQTRALAATRKPKAIASVSCNAATFARDARILIDAGWRLARVTPVDQFRYSAHVELVGAFQR